MILADLRVCQCGQAKQMFEWWSWWADMWKYGYIYTCLVFTYACLNLYSICVWLCVHACIHVETAGVRIHTLSCVCSSKHICLLLLSKTHSHLNAGDRTHLPALWAARQLSQNILEYTHIHTHARLPGVPHMRCLGSAKWNFLKAKKHFSRTN